MTILHNTKRQLILLGAISVLFLISACMHYSLIKADQDINIGNTFNVKTPIEWNKSKILYVGFPNPLAPSGLGSIRPRLRAWSITIPSSLWKAPFLEGAARHSRGSNNEESS